MNRINLPLSVTMPRRRTLTGRTERSNNRRNQYNRRSVTENSNQQSSPNRYPLRNRINANQQIDNNVANLNVLNEINVIEINDLQGTFKCAHNFIPIQFRHFHLGEMSLMCQYCNSMNFRSEITSRHITKFKLCCHKGKVNLPPLQQNELLVSYYQNYDLIESKNYFENIRSYNSAFAMVSSEANIDLNSTVDIYHFKIYDQFYHRLGPMTAQYGRNPTYAQLYFYDTDTAINHRLGMPQNNRCLRSVMNAIANELNRINHFVRSFVSMREHCENHPTKEISMVIRTDRELDLNRFNEPIATDVAVIFTSNDGEPPFNRNLIAFSKTNSTIRKVSTINPALDPLAYPLLFPNGDLGWHNGIRHSNVNNVNNIEDDEIEHNENNRRKMVTMLQYTSYRLAVRNNEFSMLHHSQKLFLQWIVDLYVRIEGSRLHYRFEIRFI